jgi:hypothetical protein
LIVAVIQVVDALEHLASTGLISSRPWSRRAPDSAIWKIFDSASSRSCPTSLPPGLSASSAMLGSDLREAPLHRALAHQLGVAADVERARRVLRQRAEVGRAAGLVLVLARLDRLRDRDHVGGPARLDQPCDMAPQPAVIVAVEVLAGDEVRDRSNAWLSSSSAPSSDCSASIECGGVLNGMTFSGEAPPAGDDWIPRLPFKCRVFSRLQTYETKRAPLRSFLPAPP